MADDFTLPSEEFALPSDDNSAGAPAPAAAPAEPEPSRLEHAGMTVTDIPHKIYEAGAAGLQKVNRYLNPFSEDYRKDQDAYMKEVASSSFLNPMPSLRRLGDTGSGLMGAAEAVTSPITGLGRSVLGHAYSAVDPYTGHPEERAKAAKLGYPAMTGDEFADKAMMLVAPGRGGLRSVHGPATPTTPALPAPVAPKPNGPLGVTLSEGQETGNLPLIQREQKALQGASGDAAQRRALAFQEQQNTEVGGAKQQVLDAADTSGSQQPLTITNPHDAAEIVADRLIADRQARDTGLQGTTAQLQREHDALRTGLSPTNSVLAESPQQAGALISRSVDAANEQARAASTAAYDQFNRLQGEFHPASFNRVRDEIVERVASPEDPSQMTLINRQTTPQAMSAVDDLQEILGGISQRRDPETGQVLPRTPVTPRLVENARQRLNSYLGDAISTARSTGSWKDVRAVERVIDTFDFMVQQKLGRTFTGGDPTQVRAAIERARGLYRDWRQTYTSRGAGDKVGSAMQNIIGRHEGQALTPEQVATTMYGPNGRALGQRLQQVFGPDSAEMGAARQGLLSHITEAPPGRAPYTPEQIANRIDQFTRGANRSMTEGYLRPFDIQALQNYGQRLRAHGANVGRELDPVDQILSRVAGTADRNPASIQDAVSHLFSSALRNSRDSVELVRRLKSRLGENSREWGAYRQGLIRHAMERGIDARDLNHQKVADNMRQLARSQVGREVFTAPQRQLLEEFGNLHEKLIVPQMGRNWSNTSAFSRPNVVNGMQWVVGAIGDLIAHSMGVPFGISEGIGFATGKASKLIADQAAVRPIAKQMPLVAEQLRKYQKALNVYAQRQNPVTTKNIAVAANSLTTTLGKLGIDLTKIPVQMPGFAPAQEQEKKRAAGGPVMDPQQLDAYQAHNLEDVVDTTSSIRMNPDNLQQPSRDTTGRLQIDDRTINPQQEAARDQVFMRMNREFEDAKSLVGAADLLQAPPHVKESARTKYDKAWQALSKEFPEMYPQALNPKASPLSRDAGVNDIGVQRAAGGGVQDETTQPTDDPNAGAPLAPEAAPAQPDFSWVDQGNMSPFEAAAYRTRQSVMPDGGRTEGKTTEALDHIGEGLYNMAARPSRIWNALNQRPTEINEFDAPDEMGINPQTKEAVAATSLDVMGLPGLAAPSVGKGVLTSGMRPVEAFHGTPTPGYEKFQRPEAGQYMPDRGLGVHFSKDPEIANTFTKTEGGVYPVRLPPEDKFYEVKQDLLPYIEDKNTPKGPRNVISDQQAVEHEIMRTAYQEDPAMFARFLEQRWNLPKEEAAEAAQKILKGEPYTNQRLSHRSDKEPIVGLDDYIQRDGVVKPWNDADRAKAVQLFQDKLKSQGYAGVKYINTSPMETAAAKDPTSYVVFDPSQHVQSKYTGTLMSGSPEANAHTAAALYSNVEKAISSAPQAKMSAEQWSGWLKNQPGVKGEELAHLGLDNPANLPKGPVTKEQLLDHVAENQVQLKEVEKGGDNIPQITSQAVTRRYEDLVDDFYHTEGRHPNMHERERLEIDARRDVEDWPDEYGPAGVTKYHGYQLPDGENYREMLLTTPFEKAAPGTSIAERMPEYQRRHALPSAWAKDPESVYRSSHWDEPNVLMHMRMNDRKIPLELSPEQQAAAKAHGEAAPKLEALRQQQAYIGRAISAASRPMEAERREAIMKEFREGKITPGELTRRLEDYVPPQEIAPLQKRLQELRAEEDAIRKGLPEKPEQPSLKSLHLEELQSDWHQAGRKRGYHSQERASALEELSKLREQREKLIKEQPQIRSLPPEFTVRPDPAGGFMVDGPGGQNLVWGETPEKAASTAVQHLNSRQGREFTQLKDKLAPIDEQIHVLERKTQEGAVPNAPFKQSWPDLGLRRAIVKAAREGHDAISWTPGAKQAERYDLSKQVDAIEAHRIGDDKFFISGKAPGSNSFTQLGTFSKDKLPDAVGKELAEKISGQNSQVKEYSGVDLKVGGEGMKAFYDKMLVDKANAIGKKYGAKVEWKELNPGYLKRADELNARKAELERLVDESWGNAEKSPIAPHRREALQNELRAVTTEMKQLGQHAGLKVPVLRLTPKLKEEALQRGLPLFANNAGKSGTAAAAASESRATIVDRGDGKFAVGGEDVNGVYHSHVVKSREEAEAIKQRIDAVPRKPLTPQDHKLLEEWVQIQNGGGDAARSVIKRLPSEPGTIYRGLVLENHELERLQPGKTLRLKDFSSASSNKEIAEEFAGLGRFGEVMPGQHPVMLHIDQFSARKIPDRDYNDYAESVLVPRSTYRVEGMTTGPKGEKVINLKEIPENDAHSPIMFSGGGPFAPTGRKDEQDVPREPAQKNNRDEPQAQKRAAGGRVVAADVHPNPTEAQKAAGNYAKSHVSLLGFNIAIENPKGSVRSGVAKDGHAWRSVLPAHYGYIKGTEGADGDHTDVYLGPHRKAPHAFIIDQLDPDTKRFDEHKVLLCFADQKQALNIYKKAFTDGKGSERIGAVVTLTLPQLKDWLRNGNTKKPLSNHH